ncbi:MAG: DUF6316 family protein [Porticoccaceae bacterium]
MTYYLVVRAKKPVTTSCFQEVFMSARHGEKEVTHFRSERILCTNGKWYFAIREKTELIGPFETKAHAKKAAAAYTEDVLSGQSEINTMSHQYQLRAYSLK